jgi:D-serine deaminase-like pyridoxal phosphate-dependent protein
MMCGPKQNIDNEARSLIGQAVDAIATPALVVDIECLQANLRFLADYFADRHCKIRPHFKSHKCVELSRRQLAAGNITGITCAKLSEAEQLVAGGVEDILIANQVVGAGKGQRLARLNRAATVRCAVDAPENARELGAAATAQGTTVPVLVEIDIGMNRCGLAANGPALDLVRQVVETEGLRFDGLHGYEGHTVMLPDAQTRAAQTRAALQPLVETRRQLETRGIEVAMVSSGGTGTYDTTGNLDGIDEVQCGSYALMDWSYAALRPEFKLARWVEVTVISARDDQAVVDVGVKGVGCEFGPPKVEGFPDARARYTAEEHIPFDHLKARLGDRLRIIPSHGCTTNNLYRWLWIARHGLIEDVWAIEGAGCLE